jgi:hypothetical protein
MEVKFNLELNFTIAVSFSSLLSNFSSELQYIAKEIREASLLMCVVFSLKNKK